MASLFHRAHLPPPFLTGPTSLAARALPALLLPAGIVVLCLITTVKGIAQPATPTPPVPPLPPAAPSPVGYFRQLLAASPEERERLLAGKSPQQLRVLTNSIRIYLNLSQSEREMRLRNMELRSYLAPLLRMAPPERTARLAAIPAEHRQVLEERLAHWDRLPTNAQHQLLSQEGIANGYPKAPPLPMPPTNSIASTSAAAFNPVLTRWTAITPAREQEVLTDLNKLIDLPPDQKGKALDPLPLSPAERALIEKALETFRQMAPAQRQACVDGFKKFAQLPPEERSQLLRSAEAWQKMAPGDRQRWRDIINIMPPMPRTPGATAPPIPPRPPPAAGSLHGSNSVAR